MEIPFSQTLQQLIYRLQQRASIALHAINRVAVHC